MITPAYSSTATERVLPRLALDFTTASLDARVTVTRSLNTATRVNSSGYIETVNANLPRFDFNPVTKICSGLLIEESRVNYITYSQDFTGADWVSDACNLSSAAGTSPDSTNNAFNCVPTTATTNHRVRQLSSGAPASGGTTSYFVKKNGYEWAKIRLGGLWANVNLTTGAAGFSNTDPVIKNYGNGWWRISLYNSSAVNGVFSYIYPLSVNENSTDPTNWAGDGTSGILLYGAQTEIGAFPTSYIPNLAAGTTTRNADAVSMTGTNFSDWYNQTQGSAAMTAVLLPGSLAAGNRRAFWFDNSGTGQYANAWQATMQPASSFVDVQVVSSSVLQSRMLPSITYTADQVVQIAAAMKTSGSAAAVLGGTVAAVSTATLPVTLDTLRIDNHRDSTYINGWAQTFRYWPQQLINAEVQAFSKR